MSNLLLGVNIDHIATLRNTRNTVYPDPIHAALIAEQSGADSITVHLREDRRHITDRDVKILRKTIQTAMNLEIAVTNEMINIACMLKPHYCCLVPERRQELTTEGGLDIINKSNKLQDIIFKLIDSGIRVSLFIDPDEQQIDAAYNIGVSCIEIHTGMYSDAVDQKTKNLEYKRIKKSVQYATDNGLKVNAGHGLDYQNVQPIAKLPEIQELNIGHSIISRSIFCGLSKAIKDMKELLQKSRRG
ncbi:pyridoxine 5'-phosphate synthase [Blochmannia endosymbiont of Camponotus sp.]|uniref:pyridoxine 5'-phosphate synthase n=1 Tax=Blochmannia endosymbiont of Camponotus sp. TaxID=700220 RepID=UPI0020255294|nr:pyridoxine 5'-phosphate synthase [Blochmannia endosymbiont of Camponotus sp.]URJ29869.1 pyridoxine 5'-phosphate synthase [Blochmannia endosymbiont of Camponotus sp.]URJ31233.1 pyridoxine 5'-phosphate synthase [Blochmannia endosymbiont of Camponotus sp.]